MHTHHAPLPSRPSRALAALAALLLVGACAEVPSTPPETASPAAAQATTAAISPSTPAETATPAATATPGPPSPTPSTTPPTPSATSNSARWIPAGTMRFAHDGPTLLCLGDGRVLAVGSVRWDAHVGNFADETSQVAELWDPATNAWRLTAALNSPRVEFAAVVLRDGRALVIGGLGDRAAAFSSAYLFDPATEQWAKTGLMTTARASAAATLLDDGRVLVVGGRYTVGYDGSGGQTEDKALATAELYDPRTGAWSPTGSMRYARHWPSIARLGDGRVLVWDGIDSNWHSASAHVEIYDPALGRFLQAPALPDPSAKSLATVGAAPVHQDWSADWRTGALYPLANGDVLMTGMTWSSSTVRIQQLVRFDANRDRWTFIGKPFVERLDPASGSVTGRWGTRHPVGSLAPLPDGRLLVVGGGSSRRVDAFDPIVDRWSPLPSLPPAATPEAVAVVLQDGSVLLAPSGGSYADAFRFAPEP